MDDRRHVPTMPILLGLQVVFANGAAAQMTGLARAVAGRCRERLHASPGEFLQGSTLWVLDRRLRAGAETSIATVVRRFTIDPDRCTGTVR